MPLQAPNLDNRTFDQLVDEAKSRIKATSPEWTDFSAGDPGMTLVELFAYLAEAMIYRLNQVPDKLYVEFLRLIGVRMAPPAAAVVTLRFSRDAKAGSGKIEIPRGTQVTVATQATGSEPPVFETIGHALLAAGKESVDVLAINAEFVAHELAGHATGQPGTWFSLARPPAITPIGDPLDLLVGVETQPSEVPEGGAAIEFDRKMYRVWREVDDFSDLPLDDPVYVADRAAGIVTFAPAAAIRRNGNGELEDVRALAGVPKEGREVRLWYRRGGGSAGNVAKELLTVMRNPIPGLQVTNPAPATGGREPESVENALIRGPQELRSLARAVTAHDYELVAERSSGVARARAFTQASLWRYATPGTVEVVIVPALPAKGGEASVTTEQLMSLETPEARDAVIRAIDERRPLGTSAEVNWARYKTVSVRGAIVVRREEDLDAVRGRVNERLRLTVNPLPTALDTDGWPFGQPLYASTVYKILLSEPGVRYARNITLKVDSVPDTAVEEVHADPFQPKTWYAGSGPNLYRTLNDGEGWELMTTFEGGAQVTVIRANRFVPGLVAAVVDMPDGKNATLYVSYDSGATWPFSRPFGFLIRDVAWSSRGGEPLVMMATDRGLYQQTIGADADIAQMLVNPDNQDLAFYAVAVTQEVKGEITVAVAAQGSGGIYLSNSGGATNTYRKIQLEGEDVRVLAVQYDGPRSYLWAATASPGGETTGKGAFRRELLGTEDPTQGWVPYGAGWNTGSCWSLAFAGSTVLAATQQRGVMRLDVNEANPVWKEPTVDSGLPIKTVNKFEPIRSVAVDPEARLAMAGGPAGVYRVTNWAARTQQDKEDTEPEYAKCSDDEFTQEVTLPATWLFTCSDNEIEVVADATE